MTLILIFALLFTPAFAHAAGMPGARPRGGAQAEPYKQPAAYNAYKQIADELLKNCDSADKAIAVAGFSYSDGHDSGDNNIVSERLTTELVKVRKIKVIERNEIDKVFAELKLQRTGSIDTDSAKTIGKMLGADWVVLGTLTELPDKQIELNARLVGVESGEIINAASTRVTKDWVEQKPRAEVKAAAAEKTAKEEGTDVRAAGPLKNDDEIFATAVFLARECSNSLYYEGDGSFKSWPAAHPRGDGGRGSYIKEEAGCDFVGVINNVIRYRHPELKQIWQNYKKENGLLAPGDH